MKYKKKVQRLKDRQAWWDSNLIHLRELLPDQVQLNKSNYEQF